MNLPTPCPPPAHPLCSPPLCSLPPLKGGERTVSDGGGRLGSRQESTGLRLIGEIVADLIAGMTDSPRRS